MAAEPEGRPHLPTPGDGGVQVLKPQDREWALSKEQAPGAAKQLRKRVERKVKDVIRLLKPGRGGGSGSDSDGSQGSDGGDRVSDRGGSSEESHPSQEPQLRRLSDSQREAPAAATVPTPSAHAAATAPAAGRTLAVQILMARGLPPSDLNGLADPYCSVTCGSEEGKTAAIYNTLEPRWNDTFVFAGSETTDEAFPERQNVFISLKDSNKHLPDDRLGWVEASLADFAGSPAPRWLDLRHPTKGATAERSDSSDGAGAKAHGSSGCGQICVAMWLAPEVMPHDAGEGPPPVVSTLCFPVGACKMLPAVLHSQQHALFEAPAAAYLDVALHQVRITNRATLLTKEQPQQRQQQQQGAFPAVQQAAEQAAGRQPAAASAPRDTNAAPDPREGMAGAAQPSFAADPASSSAEDTMSIAPESEDEDAEQETGANRSGMDWSSVTNPFGDSEGGKQGSRGDSQEKNGSEEPRGRTSHEDGDAAAGADEAWLFFKVCVSEQRQKSKMRRVEGNSLTWQHHFPFVVATPLHDQHVDVQLFRATPDRSRGRLVGTARIPLIDLMDSTADLGAPGVEAPAASWQEKRWFEVHHWVDGSGSGRGSGGGSGKSSESSGDRRVLGAVQLSLDMVDADNRRQLYSQPLLDLRRPAAGGKSMLHTARGGVDAAVQQATSVPRSLPSVTRRALGTLSLTLRHVELAEEAHCFGVVACGPHWGVTPIVADSKRPSFMWQVHLPIHDPYTLFQLGIFKSGDSKRIKAVKRRMFLQDKPLLLGKLRVRLSAVAPGKTFTVALPMLAGRRNGGKRTATAHLSMRVDYSSWKEQLWSYTRPPLPKHAYESAISRFANDKEVNNQGRKMVAQWLEASQPSIPESVADSMADDARDEFSLPRAHINFRRCQEALNGIKRFGNLYAHTKSWRNPLLSVAMHGMVWLMCYRTTIFALICTGGAIYHTLRRADPSKGAPKAMEEDPTGLKEDGHDEDGQRQKGLGIKIRVKGKYVQLVEVCLRFSNGLDDIACFFERFQSSLAWQDPTATAVCLVLLLLLGTACTAVGFPTVLCTILFIMLRHPVLRTPTPPAPANFFMRLPTRSDRIM